MLTPLEIFHTYYCENQLPIMRFIKKNREIVTVFTKQDNHYSIDRHGKEYIVFYMLDGSVRRAYTAAGYGTREEHPPVLIKIQHTELLRLSKRLLWR